MAAESVPWKAVTFVVMVLAVVVPAYVAYDLYERGPSPEKRVEILSISPINPLADLSGLKDKATISVAVGDEVLNNLIIAQAFFTNTGEVPILPRDYHKNLSVSVDDPWKIVVVDNRRHGWQNVRLDWKRVSARQFEAEPALLNPGDEAAVRVYLTNTEFEGFFASEDTAEPSLEWNARIANLRSFTKGPSILERLQDEYSVFPPIEVTLSGWAVPFTIGAALLFQVLYLHFLTRSKLLRQWRWHAIALVACTSLISFSAAECLATYLFESRSTRILGVNHWLNLPPIVLNAVFLMFLWWKVKGGAEKASA